MDRPLCQELVVGSSCKEFCHTSEQNLEKQRIALPPLSTLPGSPGFQTPGFQAGLKHQPISPSPAWRWWGVNIASSADALPLSYRSVVRTVPGTICLNVVPYRCYWTTAPFILDHWMCLLRQMGLVALHWLSLIYVKQALNTHNVPCQYKLFPPFPQCSDRVAWE